MATKLSIEERTAKQIAKRQVDRTAKFISQMAAYETMVVNGFFIYQPISFMVVPALNSEFVIVMRTGNTITPTKYAPSSSVENLTKLADRLIEAYRSQTIRNQHRMGFNLDQK
jgi:hypothetical protein